MTDNEIIRKLRENEAENQCTCMCDKCDEDDCLTPLFREAADVIERLTAENAALREKVPQWISVEDRLPEVWINEEDDVLVNYMIYSPDFGVDIGSYHAKAQRWVCMGLPCTVTHWMPLPGAPEGGKHE